MKKSLTLKKIYGIYNEINDSILLYYQTDDSIEYIILKDCTKYFNIEIKNVTLLMPNDYYVRINLTTLISPIENYGLYTSSLYLRGWSLSSGFSNFEETQILLLYSNPRNYKLSIEYRFYFVNEELKMDLIIIFIFLLLYQ